MTKTIRKNSFKKIALVGSLIEEMKSYTLSNCFRGEEFSNRVENKSEWLADELDSGMRTKLTVDLEKKTATLYFHSNSWVEMTLRSTDGI